MDKKKRLLVVSFDAMGPKDLEKVKEFPNFKRILKEGSYSTEVAGISPSLTYPAHTSIITGCLPDKHGIVANTLLQADKKNPDWYWQSSYIKTQTLYDLALKNKMKVAALLWPVTAKSKITYNFPEIFSNSFWKSQAMVSLSNGSFGYQYKLNKKYGHLRKGIGQPYLDDFIEACLIDTIENLDPELILVHFVDLDYMRHHYGYHSDQAQEALLRHEKRLGSILTCLDKNDLADSTTLAILGDHDQKPVHSVISLYRLFEQKALVEFKRSKLKAYDLLTKSCDGSSYIYLKDKAQIMRVREALEEFKNSSHAIRTILEKDQIKAIGADSKADFMVDANDGYYFTDQIEDMVINKVNPKDGKAPEGYLLSSHGYISDENAYKTIFAIKGPGILEDFDIGPMSLLDEAETFAKVLGLEFEGTQGRLLEEIFKVKE